MLLEDIFIKNYSPLSVTQQSTLHNARTNSPGNWTNGILRLLNIKLKVHFRWKDPHSTNLNIKLCMYFGSTENFPNFPY